MQDAKKIQDQVDEMVVRTDIKATILEEHKNLIATRKVAAERELMKMKFLREMFEIGGRLLEQREAQLRQAEQQPSAAAFEGLMGAKIELSRLEQQAKEKVISHDGAFAALLDMESTIQKEEAAAVARGRGLVTQGERLVQTAEEAAEASGEIEAVEQVTSAPAPSGDPQEVPGFLDSLEQVRDAEEPAQEAAEEDLAKEPMAAPQQKATKKRSRRKA